MNTSTSTQEMIQEIRNQLQKQGTEAFRARQIQSLKETVQLYGVQINKLKSICKPFKSLLSSLNKEDTFELCEQLWASGFLEERLIACYWVYDKRADFVATDLTIFARWIDQYVDNLVVCDAFCHHSVAHILETFPSLAPHVLKWTASPNPWVRRASPVSTMLPARKGKYLALSLTIADMLQDDPEPMVLKAYGCLLKELSIKHELDVFEYLTSYKAHIPPIAFRAAVGNLRPELKIRALEYEEPDWDKEEIFDQFECSYY